MLARYLGGENAKVSSNGKIDCRVIGPIAVQRCKYEKPIGRRRGLIFLEEPKAIPIAIKEQQSAMVFSAFRGIGN